MAEIVGDGEIVVEYRVAPGADQKLRTNASKSAQDAGDEAGNKFAKGFSDGLVTLGGVEIARRVGTFLKGTIDSASDLNETISKSNTIFGSAAASIEAWADDANEALGQSKQQALGAAASFGNLFSQLGISSGAAADMSKQMVELATDFASFHNADISEVLEAQTAAFRGEYDSVQKFVPVINAANVEQKALELGLAATTGELTAQDKAIATHKLLIEGAGAATGDFARTSDGLANQQRILAASLEDMKAKIGTALIPVMQQLVGFAGTAVSVLEGLPSGVTAGGIALVGLGAAAVGLTRGITIMRDAQETLNGLGRAGEFASRGLGALAKGGAFVGIVVALDQALGKLQDKLNEALEGTGNFDRTLATLASSGAKDLGGALFDANLDLDEFTKHLDDSDRVINKLFGDTFGGFGGRIKTGLAAAKDEADVLDKALAQLAASGEEGEQKAREFFAAFAERAGVDVGTAQKAFDDYTKALDANDAKAATAALSQGDLGAAVEETGEITEDTRSEFEKITEAVDAYRKALDEALGVSLDVNEASRNFQEALDELDAAISENGHNFDIHTEAGRKNQAALDAVVQSAIDEVAALTEAGKIAVNTEAQHAALAQRLGHLANSDIPYVKEAVQGYINEALKAVPKDVGTKITVDIATALASLDALDLKYQQVANGVIVGTPTPSTPRLGSGLKRQHGGPVEAFRPYEVNENTKNAALLIPLVPGHVEASSPSSSPPVIQEAPIIIEALTLVGDDLSPLTDVSRKLRDSMFLSGRRA